ncbi:ribose transport system ATP-binding protein [Tistlia consotensis]|uniref:Monosaccharide ABC transporter ATP-binding protein, CUT2 family n=1 Tax=Tistlia consotensis USBA 355 TaxID=560819 RepID=A0A1Y6BHR2_9PROT|nr:sugar ABC transporter ATP-binding protein [Tistlia consotensis]SMF12383.1 monosaccharide ABC transporter ATP-binding protein, CUT2 family [Tistlia consotensis USBA 355]SNR51148.1 ribose transport system ATP-binding protein [Tistlia consotensis]
MIQAAAPAVSLVGVRKSFGATVAVDDVSFEIAPGSVHALLGENGAGKSTIVKLLSGLLEPDHGRFEVFGGTVALASPRHAHRAGIQTAFQEMTLVRDLTVLDNMLMPYAPVGPSGMIRRRRAAEALRAHFDRLGFEVDLGAEVGELDLAVQQKLEIARALFREPRILLLDEPTSTLTGRDVDWLGEIIAEEKRRGVTIVFISHRMREVRAFCDRLTILRNGQHITSGAVGEISDREVIELIVGRSLDQTYPDRTRAPGAIGEPVLGCRDLSAGAKLRHASFTLHRGEILGVAGLQGMGQLELFHACFGLAETHRGRIEVDGRPVVMTSPRDALRPEIGIGLVPQDRKSEGLFLKLDGRRNASLPVIGRLTRPLLSGGLIDGARELEEVGATFDRVEIDRRALWTRVSAFSGGNQQKIVLAKWLFAESRILLLFDPTRGIDVGTKHEIYLLMRAFADQGGSILFHSTEVPELVNLSDRVVVLYGGRTVETLAGDALEETTIMRAALGGSDVVEEAAS